MSEGRKDNFLLAKKIGDVHSLEKIDTFVREGPKTLASRDILQRVAQMDKGPEFMELGSAYLANMISLLVSEPGENLKAADGELQKVTAELKATSTSMQSISEELAGEKQSSQALQSRVAEVEENAAAMELELELSKTREAEMTGQLANSSKDAIIVEYKASDEFTMDWMDKVLPYYDQGKLHVLRMPATGGASSFQLFKWGETAYYSAVPRAMHHLVPFSENELEILKQREPEWSPLAFISQNISYLLEVARTGGLSR